MMQETSDRLDTPLAATALSVLLQLPTVSAASAVPFTRVYVHLVSDKEEGQAVVAVAGICFLAAA